MLEKYGKFKKNKKLNFISKNCKSQTKKKKLKKRKFKKI